MKWAGLEGRLYPHATSEETSSSTATKAGNEAWIRRKPAKLVAAFSIISHYTLHAAFFHKELLRRGAAALLWFDQYDLIENPVVLLVRALTLRPSGQRRKLDRAKTALHRVSSHKAEVPNPGTFLL